LIDGVAVLVRLTLYIAKRQLSLINGYCGG